MSTKRQTRVVAPNSTECYSLPETDICSTLTFVLALNQGADSIFCPIRNSTIGSQLFRSCNGLPEADSSPTIPMNGRVCLNAVTNETTFHFQCITAPCSDSCLVMTTVSSHRIIIGGTSYHESEWNNSEIFYECMFILSRAKGE